MNRRREGAGDKYTLQALVALYEFEPSLNDVLVEGRADAGLLRWYLREQDRRVSVRAVDDVVDVPSYEVARIGFDINARGRAMAVASALSETLPASQVTPVVVVDADWHAAVGPQLAARRFLIMTDMPASENYCLQPRPLQKFLDLVLGARDEVDASSVVDTLANALVELHAVRIVLHHLAESCANNPAALVSFNAGTSSLNKAELIRRSCSSGAYSETDRNELLSEAEWYEMALRDAAQGGRGHDIGPLLIRYLDLSGHYADVRTVESTLRGCLEVSDLDSWSLFTELRRRIAPYPNAA